MHQKQHKGFSLLELLLVFLIAGALIFVGIGQYKRLKRQANVEAVKYNVDLLRQATITYYRKHISDFNPDPRVFNLNALITEGFWPPKQLLKTNLITGYSVSAANITPSGQTTKIYNFTATITLPSSEAGNLTWLQNFLNATSSDATNNTLSWLYLPTYSLPTMDTGLWILNTDLQQFKKDAGKVN